MLQFDRLFSTPTTSIRSMRGRRRWWWIWMFAMALAMMSATTFARHRQEEEDEEPLVYDVLVYGATPSGILAAVTACRILSKQQHPSSPQRHRVLLVNPSHHLGGMVTGGLGQTDVGAAPELVLGGLTLEFFTNVAALYRQSKVEQPRAPWNVEPHMAQAVFWQLLEQENHQQVNNTKTQHLQLVVVQNVGGVESVQWEESTTTTDTDRNSSRRLSTLVTVGNFTAAAKVFIDASYEGDLMARAGVPFVIGREGREKYGEAFAGNLGVNDAHTFVVPVDPYEEEEKKDQHQDATTTIASTNNTAATNIISQKKKLLPYLLTPLPEGAAGDADSKIQSYNFRLCVTANPSNRIPFAKPSKYEPHRWELLRRYVVQLVATNRTDLLKVPSPNLGPLARHKYDCNNGGPISTDFVGGSWEYPTASYPKRQELWEAHKQYTLELFWFWKHDQSVPKETREEMGRWGLCADEFLTTNHWPPQLYVREARRMVGTQVFTQRSIEDQLKLRSNHRHNGIPKDAIGLSSVGLGSYIYDSHTAQRVASSSKEEGGTGRTFFAKNEGDLERGLSNSKAPAHAQYDAPDIYQIPHWVLLPKKEDVPNLLVSVCVSASHVAYSTLRMEPQFMILGQAAGTIAALSVLNHPTTNTTTSSSGRTGISRAAPVQDVELRTLRKQLLEMHQKVVIDPLVLDAQQREVYDSPQ